MELSDLYYNTSTGYGSLQDLIKQSKAHSLNLSTTTITEWYNKQPVNQIYKPIRAVKTHSKIVSHSLHSGEIYVDLMDVSRFSRNNKGIKYLLNCIDLYSRFVWSFPLKTKKPSEIEPYIKEVIQSIPNKTDMTFSFDNGSEFKGEVKALLDKLEIPIYLNDPSALNAHHKMALIERFNRTLWNYFKKYLSYNNTLTYIDELPNFIHNYNNRIHSTTKRKPINALKDKSPLIVVTNEDITDMIQPINVFKIGDLVRTQKLRRTFDKKGLLPTFSKKVHKIIGLQYNKYLVDNGKSYYAEQLVKATDEVIDDKIFKLNENENRKERKLKEDFKLPLEQIEKQIVSTKRERKPTAHYGFTY